VQLFCTYFAVQKLLNFRQFFGMLLVCVELVKNQTLIRFFAATGKKHREVNVLITLRCCA
jgi:hypothetical protein